MIPFFTRKSKPAVQSTDAASDLEIDVVVDVDLADLEDDELELTDEDFVLLEAAPPPAPISRSVVQAALAAVPAPTERPSRPISQARLDTLRTKTLRAGLRTESESPPPPPASIELAREARRSFSRLNLDEDAEASVADECLATIAAAASHARIPDALIPAAASSSRPRARDEVDALLDGVSSLGTLPLPSVPPRSSSAVTIPPPASSAPLVVAVSPRLPPVSPPPFVRESIPSARISIPGVLPEVSDENDAAETLPVPMRTPFVRTTTDDERASRPSLPQITRSATLTPSARSVAPVSVPKHDANVTVVVRDRAPRMGWVVAAAAIGALAAVTVMRVAAPSSSAAPAVAALPSPPAPAPAQASAVVRFGEEEGVSIKVPAPVASPAPSSSQAARVASPAPAPRPAHHAAAPAARPSRPLNPKVAPPIPLPDGSLGLANTSKATPSASAPAPAPTPLPLPPSGGRKRPLTPEQELAEAQLRAASMR